MAEVELETITIEGSRSLSAASTGLLKHKVEAGGQRVVAMALGADDPPSILISAVLVDGEPLNIADRVPLSLLGSAGLLELDVQVWRTIAIRFENIDSRPRKAWARVILADPAPPEPDPGTQLPEGGEENPR